MRVRGLKRDLAPRYLAAVAVAPRAGAWIETPGVCGKGRFNRVAPRAGAWIETLIAMAGDKVIMRRTPCGCVD